MEGGGVFAAADSGGEAHPIADRLALLVRVQQYGVEAEDSTGPRKLPAYQLPWQRPLVQRPVSLPAHGQFGLRKQTAHPVGRTGPLERLRSGGRQRDAELPVVRPVSRAPGEPGPDTVVVRVERELEAVVPPDARTGAFLDEGVITHVGGEIEVDVVPRHIEGRTQVVDTGPQLGRGRVRGIEVLLSVQPNGRQRQEFREHAVDSRWRGQARDRVHGGFGRELHGPVRRGLQPCPEHARSTRKGSGDG